MDCKITYVENIDNLSNKSLSTKSFECHIEGIGIHDMPHALYGKWENC